jgi:DNA-dependent RNA polymerase auxiliary subunit epsilon
VKEEDLSLNNNYEEFRAEVFSAMRGLARQNPAFADAQMLVASSDVTASLKRSTIHKNIDTEWVDRIDDTIPYLDVIIRNPTIMIEDVDEILPVELSRNIAEKTIKHLAQHTNMIQAIKEDGEIIPQRLLNVHHEETLVTYENKFINTLLTRLSAFVDTRYKQLQGGRGTERLYQLRYSTEFDHRDSDYGESNQAKVQLSIDLSSPSNELTEAEAEANEIFIKTLARIKRIKDALASYMSSPFVKSLAKNYIRPPVIRTNAILKNKNMRVCLNLWEYLENYDKAGFSSVSDEFTEMPSDNYISDLYSSVALQYTNFYNGVAESPESNRLLANRRLSEVYPDFDPDFDVEELEDYKVYDSEYKKVVPVSRLSNLHKKLSRDERRIRLAIIAALDAEEILIADELAREAEERRLARERRLAEEEAIRRAAEEEARRIAEEEARRLAEEEARKLAEEEAKRLAAEEEARRLAAEEEARRLAEEEEERRLAEEEEARRIAAEEEAKRLAEEEAARIAAIKAAISTNRIKTEEKPEFMYLDSDPDKIPERAVIIPYTREQYLALPRKKKKSVLTTVRSIIDYRDTKDALDKLMNENMANPYNLERIARLEDKLAEYEKALPKSIFWDECIRQLKK